MRTNGEINEVYYTQNNHPNFKQFPRDYDFYDDKGRVYLIATKNKQPFQNTRFAMPRNHPTVMRQPRREPVKNNYGYTKLFVKLPSSDMQWFTRRDINKPLQLIRRDGTLHVDVILKNDEKSNPRLRAGAIWVANL